MEETLYYFRTWKVLVQAGLYASVQHICRKKRESWGTEKKREIGILKNWSLKDKERKWTSAFSSCILTYFHISKKYDCLELNHHRPEKACIQINNILKLQGRFKQESHEEECFPVVNLKPASDSAGNVALFFRHLSRPDRWPSTTHRWDWPPALLQTLH